MKAAEGVPGRARLVVLNELQLDPELSPPIVAKRLDQEATLVAVDLGLDQGEPVYLGVESARH